MPNYAQNYASTIDSSLVAIPEIFVQMQGSNTGNSSICSIGGHVCKFVLIHTLYSGQKIVLASKQPYSR